MGFSCKFPLNQSIDLSKTSEEWSKTTIETKVPPRRWLDPSQSTWILNHLKSRLVASNWGGLLNLLQWIWVCSKKGDNPKLHFLPEKKLFRNLFLLTQRKKKHIQYALSNLGAQKNHQPHSAALTFAWSTKKQGDCWRWLTNSANLIISCVYSWA